MQARHVRHPVAGTQPSRSRVVPLVAMIALLSMPVQYRGGAALPHPHALFQLWSPGGHGLVHHDPHADAPIPGMNVSERTNGDPNVVLGAAFRDQPALTAMTMLGEQAAVVGVVILAALLLVFDRSTFRGDVSRRLVGFTLAPIHPPPR